MPHPESGRARSRRSIPAGRFASGGTVLLLLALTAAGNLEAQKAGNVQNTRHNLSVSGPGTVKALSENRICVFCHTPHNSTPQSPLWNRALEPQTYTVYWSPTLNAAPLPQPSGPTKLCLSCHDGTIALGSVVSPAAGIAMTGGGVIPPTSASLFGLDLSGHHPVSFPYHAALPDPELTTPPPANLTYGGADEIHCSTCHDPHDDQFGNFLVRATPTVLCTTCHLLKRWPAASHATSTASLLGVQLPPQSAEAGASRLADLGCVACHTSHGAPTAEGLLLFTGRRPSPYSCTSVGCHSVAGGGTASTSGAPISPLAELPGGATGNRRVDIGRQVAKASAHHEPPGELLSGGRGEGTAAAGDRRLSCRSCHDPHASSRRAAAPPYASGLLDGVSGVDRNGSRVAEVTFEYEVCLRCHGDASGDRELVPRVVASTNTRRDFDPTNPSYHPVLSMGRDLDVPSIPSSLSPGLTATQVIGCTSCHADDEGGSRGPHGSSYPPILKERYETVGGVGESYESYALCYRCHDRGSILSNASFRARTARRTPSGGGHRGHLAAGASCAACHDPHGVSPGLSAGGLETGDHRHLINFDLRVVRPVPGANFPVYKSNGPFSGNCTLVCHGVTHDRVSASYP